MLKDWQKEYIRSKLATVPAERQRGFTRWLIRILKTDPTAPWDNYTEAKRLGLKEEWK